MKKIFLIVFLCSINILYSQIKFDGVVKDSLGSTLELANIIVLDQETNTLDSYSITDERGYYSFELEKNTNYKFQVSYIGMNSFEEIISTKESNITRDFLLQPDNALEEVELTYEMPVTIKGDTIVYNADSFKNGSERKLEDVLEKLPGVEINEDGQVEVEGKVVNKLMVNGKDFFDGDTKIATKNIPSNAVDKIQVLRNYSEVGQLSSVTNNKDNFALNIKLKEGKENFWFGSINSGGGYSKEDKGLYLLQPKLFYYSPKVTYNFIGDINNIGEVVLTPRDIRNFGGGFRSPSRGSGTNIDLGSNSLGFLTNQNNALSVENILAASNFSWSPTNALDISGFAIYNSSLIDSKQRTVKQFTDSDLGIPNELTEQTSHERSDQGLLKLSASYKPNGDNQVDYDVLSRISKDSQNQNLVSSVIGNTSQLDETTPFSVNQNLNYYYTLNETNIFAFEAKSTCTNYILTMVWLLMILNIILRTYT